MPIVVKDYTWVETESLITITVPLKGVHAKKLDIFMTDEYLKANYAPFFFECFLRNKIDHKKSVTHIGNGEVIFQLYKEIPGLWNQLESEITVDKNAMNLKRKEMIEKAQKEAEDEKTQNDETKRKKEKYALKKIMKIEEEEKERIQKIKDDEKQKAMEELEKWKEEQKILAEKTKQKVLQNQREIKENSIKKEKLTKQQKNKTDLLTMNPLRPVGNINVNFTPRVFPTPFRESQSHEEEEWLRKQAETRRINEVFDKDLSEEEKNPDLLQIKGNNFFQSGNYPAAINVYTHAIKLNNKIPALYSNRAACHLKVRNFMKCIKDCSTAVDLMHPCVTQNATSRCRALVRRGTAFCELELYIEGLQDYEAALKLDSNNKQLEKDAENIRCIIQGTS